MALKQITSTGSPYTLTVNDFSQLLNIPYCLLIASGGGAITVNLPTINSINKFGRVLVICADGITTVTINSNAIDAISESGSISASKTITGNKNFIDLQATTYISGNIWLGSTNGGSGGGGGGVVVPITYNDLVNLAGANNLTQTNYYLITDFQTVTYIQFSGGGVGSEDINVGAIEPMLVQAATSNSFSTNIISTLVPTDEITWVASFADRDWDAVAGQSTGVITSRYDTINKLYRDYDWRNIIFRRWETVSGSGIFDNPLDTGFAFQDYPPFPAVDDFNVSIGSPTVQASNFGIPYQLDNTVGKTIMQNLKYQICFVVNVEGEFSSSEGIAILNTIISTYDPLISPDFAANNVQLVIGNVLDSMQSNTGNFIANNSRLNNSLGIYANIFSEIEGNNFDGQIDDNQVGIILNNTSQLANCLIQRNVGNDIDSNVDFANITSNSVIRIFNNIGDGIQSMTISNNVGNSISDNSSFSNIENNNVAFIEDNTSTAMDIENNVGNVIRNNTDLQTISDNNVTTITDNVNNGAGNFILSSNSGVLLSFNDVSGNVTIQNNNFFQIYDNVFPSDTQVIGNNVNSISTNSFDIVSKFTYNVGDLFNNNTFNLLLGMPKDFTENVFGTLDSNTILERGVNNNTFIANIESKTFTPTVRMDSAIPSVTIYDLALFDVEQSLNNGVLSYTAF
jgi:hypothetical protein